jgi:addiction module HigA family antidote
MSRFSKFLSGLGGTAKSKPDDGLPLRTQQRRQRMDDATVSLAEIRADAALMAGRAPDPDSPIHPGEILWEEFMKPLGVKAPTTAKALGVPRTRIERLVAGQTALSPDTALRLSRAFTSTTPLFWMNLQAAYDVDMAEQELALSLADIRPFKPRPGEMQTSRP